MGESADLLPLLVFLATGAAGGWFGRGAVRRAAGLRWAAVAAGAVVAVPCRARRRQGVHRRFFRYGKLGVGVGADGVGSAGFKAPLRPAVALPVGGRAVLRENRRPGMLVLEYRAPDGQRIDFLVCAGEVGPAGRYLWVPDADWVRPCGGSGGRSRPVGRRVGRRGHRGRRSRRGRRGRRA